MIYCNVGEVKNYSRIEHVSSFPLSPLGFMQICHFPADLFCRDHAFNSYYTILFNSGDITFSELGREKHRCRRGDLIILPKHCLFSWQTDADTSSFHCRHSGFSICDYGRLSILFGIGLDHLQRVHIGEELTCEFEEKIQTAKAHQAKELFYSTAILELYSHAVEIYCSESQTDVGSESSTSQIRQYIYYIESHLNREISIRELAQYCNISERSLFLLFQKHMNMSPQQYIASRKVEAAKRLIFSSELSCDELAWELGFSSSNYFIRFFKNIPE